MQATHWNREFRETAWRTLPSDWDIVVVGGGITGAGILSEATLLGLRVLLVEQRDFAWGTSSRSSKLVHGGLRYLKSGQISVTRASVQGREQLLAEGAGLVDPLGFLLAHYEGDRPGRAVYQAGLTVYDLMAMQWSHRYYSAHDFKMMAPYISPTGLQGGFHYSDAQTDDARLVLRVIREAVANGGVALNYVRAERLLYEHDALVGVTLRDVPTDREVDVFARVIINATGAWADTLRAQTGANARLRPLRGSHLIFPAWRFPVAQAVSFLHPIDGRPVFAFPWEGVTLLGTTDVDCPPPLDRDPCITADEVAYLMAAVAEGFPALSLTLDDVIASFAGIRPVIDSGRADPSEESRDHVVWQENGLLTVTGGKLTTFRQTARHALEQVCEQLDGGRDIREWRLEKLREDSPILKPLSNSFAGSEALPGDVRRRLLGRYGSDAPELLMAAGEGELAQIPETPVLWAELRWSARAEGIVHLDDLLLRRARLGLLAPEGATGLLPRIREICQPELGWDDERWVQEEARYRALWHESYALPPRETIPDWNQLLSEARARHEVEFTATTHQRAVQRRWALGALVVWVLALVFLRRWLSHRRRNRSHA